jgi:HAD superfamily hydrolase (TIGR01490 family)
MFMDNPSNTLTIFDVDRTLIDGQTQRLFLKLMRQYDMVSHEDYSWILEWFSAYNMGLVKETEQVRSQAYKLLKDVCVEKIGQIIDQNFTLFTDKIYNDALEQVKMHTHKGDKLILLSGSISLIIERIAKFLNIDDVIATELDIDNGLFTGKIRGKAAYGHGKLEKLLVFIATRFPTVEKTYFYTDNFSDLPVLEYVTHPVCVNPDKFLSSFALEREWTIEKWG